MSDIRAMNAAKVVVVAATNAVAVACFAAAGRVWWPQTAVVLAAAVAGGYGGASLARRLPAPALRAVGIASRLDDFKTVKDAFGGPVNDVVLAVVTGALRSFLISRGRRTEGTELRALVPVSVRVEDERDQGGNRLVVMRGPLPVYIADPIQRLRFVSHAMDGLKESKQALGAEVIAGAQNFAPPTILAQASRLNFSTRLFNLIVTNIPGPQFPLYVLGREMLQAFPVAFLPENHALAIGIMSYNGQMNFGLLGDFDSLPDIDKISDGIAQELATLVALARESVAAPA